MEAIVGFLNWLESREGLLSAITALAAMAGILYGLISFIFPGFNKAVRNRFVAAGFGEAAPVAGDNPKPGARTGGKITRSSIAVLPLRTLSPEESDQNMAAGISSEISADLAQLPDLRVASHLAAMQFQGSVDLEEVAKNLRVHYALTGNFQRIGDRLRLMVELTDIENGEQIWASTYDRQVEDLFEVQGEVSKAIVAAIGGEIKLADTRIAYDAPTRSLDAWGLVQKAFNFWLTRYTPDDFDKSLVLLRKAVKLDPQYAAARASMAMILSMRYTYCISRDPETDSREALEQIEQAVRLGPRDLTVLECAGLVWTHHGMHEKALEALRLAVELAPLNLMAQGYLAFNLSWTGTDEEAEEGMNILNHLLTLAPKHPSRPYWVYFRAGAHTRLGNWAEAKQDAEEMLRMQPEYFFAWVLLANIHGQTGETEKAREAIKNSLAINPMLTPEKVVERYQENCVTEERAEPFLSGLRKAELI